MRIEIRSPRGLPAPDGDEVAAIVAVFLAAESANGVAAKTPTSRWRLAGRDYRDVTEAAAWHRNDMQSGGHLFGVSGDGGMGDRR